MSKAASPLFNDGAKLVSGAEWVAACDRLIAERLTFGEKALRLVSESVSAQLAPFNRASGAAGVYQDPAGQRFFTGAYLADQAQREISQSIAPELTRKCWAIGAEAFAKVPDYSNGLKHMRPVV